MHTYTHAHIHTCTHTHTHTYTHIHTHQCWDAFHMAFVGIFSLSHFFDFYSFTLFLLVYSIFRTILHVIWFSLKCCRLLTLITNSVLITSFTFITSKYFFLNTSKQVITRMKMMKVINKKQMQVSRKV